MTWCWRGKYLLCYEGEASEPAICAVIYSQQTLGVGRGGTFQESCSLLWRDVACRTERDSLLWLEWFKKSCLQPHVSVPWLEAVLSLAANTPLTNSPLPSVESQ